MGKQHIIKSVEVECVKWYTAKILAHVLGYTHTRQAMRHNVMIDNKRQLKELNPQEQYDPGFLLNHRHSMKVQHTDDDPIYFDITTQKHCMRY